MHGADIGIALDGDADRVVLVDEQGRLIDGDQLMATIADLWKRGRPADRRRPGRHGDVQSRPGALSRRAQACRWCAPQVGDRYVVERMRADGFNLGGEQSGHIIMTDYATTGDGLMAALQVLAALIKSGRPASETFRAFEPVPQLLKNVRVGDANAALDAARCGRRSPPPRRDLGQGGRILVRKSGTEPLIRVMAEGDDSELVRTVVDQIIEAIPRAKAGDEGPRPDRRRLGFRRRRGHPGRHQGGDRDGRLRRHRDHRADGAEHARACTASCRSSPPSSPSRSRSC